MLEVCRRLRGRSNLPILMLTARGDAMDRVVGLELGADDYLPKPFEPRELLARLNAILRRARADTKSEMLRFGRLEIDVGARQVRLDGEACALTSHQFTLLLLLAQHAGRVMSREAIMDQLSSERLDVFDRSIDVHVSRIRAAIEDDFIVKRVDREKLPQIGHDWPKTLHGHLEIEPHLDNDLAPARPAADNHCMGRLCRP